MGRMRDAIIGKKAEVKVVVIAAEQLAVGENVVVKCPGTTGKRGLRAIVYPEPTACNLAPLSTDVPSNKLPELVSRPR